MRGEGGSKTVADGDCPAWLGEAGGLLHPQINDEFSERSNAVL